MIIDASTRYSHPCKLALMVRLKVGVFRLSSGLAFLMGLKAGDMVAFNFENGIYHVFKSDKGFTLRAENKTNSLLFNSKLVASMILNELPHLPNNKYINIQVGREPSEFGFELILKSIKI